MLEPNNRRLLLEALRPPDGWRLDWAVGTTYTLDLIALLTAPVAFAFSDWQGSDGKPVMDPLALLKAVRQYAGKVCLFCQAGKIHVPRAYQPLLASLEDSVMEANAPLGGSFHPKMWFLRFVEVDAGTVHYRVLCASRNMTFDRCWDTLLCLDGSLRDRQNAYATNHPLGQFLEALPEMCVRPLTKKWKRRLKQLAHEIRRVEFEIPEPFDKMDFWPIGLQPNEPWPFPDRIDQLFMISPFVDDAFLDDLTSKWATPMQLLSRSESLACITPAKLGSLSKVWILDDTANPEAADAELADPGQEPTTEATEEVTESPLVGLHAKVYVADAGWDAHVFTGSANATHAAFHRNVEFLIELQGKKSRCGVEALLGKGSDGQRRVSSLVDLLQPFKPAEPSDVDSEEIEFERRVDRLAKTLSESAPAAECRPAMAGTEGYALQLRPSRSLKRGSNLDIRLQVRPISLPQAVLTPVDLTAAIWAEFSSVTLLGLTSFFVFRAESVDQKLCRQFVLNIPLAGAPDHRSEAVLRELLSDRDRVLSFLLLLVADAGARDIGRLTASGVKSEVDGFVASPFGTTLLESLVRALDRDPERVDQVAEVIRDLEQSSEGKQLLPDDLALIWQPILDARAEQIARGHQ